MSYAVTQVKSCPMSVDTCAETVIKHISDFYTRNANAELTFDVAKIVEEACGRYTRGKNKGKLRGYAYMLVCIKGGWKRLGEGHLNGFVAYPGQVLGITIKDFNGKPYLGIGSEV